MISFVLFQVKLILFNTNLITKTKNNISFMKTIFKKV